MDAPDQEPTMQPGAGLTPSPEPLPPYLRPRPGGFSLAVRVQPRASHNAVAGPVGDALRVRLTAPPVEAAANEALIQFLAARLDCPRGAIRILRGHTSRHKLLEVRGLAPPAAAVRLAADA